MRPLRLAAALGGLLTLGIVATVGATEAAVSAAPPRTAHEHTIIVPGEDRFTPFAATARVGEIGRASCRERVSSVV